MLSQGAELVLTKTTVSCGEDQRTLREDIAFLLGFGPLELGDLGSFGRGWTGLVRVRTVYSNEQHIPPTNNSKIPLILLSILKRPKRFYLW